MRTSSQCRQRRCGLRSTETVHNRTMKTILALLLSFLFLTPCFSQKITIPANLLIEFELPPQTNETSVIIITNIAYYINTNIFITNVITTNIFTTINITTNITIIGGGIGTPKIVLLSDNVINPDLGTRLQRNFAIPTAFTLGSFATNSYTTFYWRNPNRQRITWPPGIVWLNGLPPTNQIRGAVLFEHIPSEGTIWATQ